MERIPEIKASFSLMKRDGVDFDREAVSRLLDLTPTCSRPPEPGKGLLYADGSEPGADLPGLTVLPAERPPYAYLKNAAWELELPKEKSWSAQETLRTLADRLEGRSGQVRALCEAFDLFALVELTLYADASTLPEVGLSCEDLAFWAEMGAEVNFAFYLD